MDRSAIGQRFPPRLGPKYLVWDRDKIYGPAFVRRVRAMYYLRSRTDLTLHKDAPELRKRESIDGGKVVALPMVGGLHHRYTRRAA